MLKGEKDPKETEKDSDGNSKVADPAKDAGNSDDSGSGAGAKKEDENLTLEESTYKQRYGNATREFQDFKSKKEEEVKALREALGLGPDDSLDKITKKDQNQSDGSKDDQKKDDDSNGEKDDKDQNKNQDDNADANKSVNDKNDLGDKKETPVDPSSLSYDNLVDPTERTAMDLVWDDFAEKHPEVDTDVAVRQEIIKEFKRFKTDALGNRVSLKKALADTYSWINRDKEIEKAKQEAYDKALLEATKNSNGAIQQPPASKNTDGEGQKTELSSKEREVAKKLHMTDEEYKKFKENPDDEDDDEE